MVIQAGPETTQKLLPVTKDVAGHATAKEILKMSFSPLIVSH
jgi:hypothetical protein